MRPQGTSPPYLKANKLGKLKGLWHAAGILDDHLMADLQQEHLRLGEDWGLKYQLGTAHQILNRWMRTPASTLEWRIL